MADTGELADRARALLSELADTAARTLTDLANKHGDTVTDTVGKAADYVDSHSGGWTTQASTAVRDFTAATVAAARGEAGGQPGTE